MSLLQETSYTILIEGNIGAGKSTFLKYFDQFECVEVVSEPLEMFQNLNGTNLLDLVYKDGEKWSFPFQTYVHLLMLQSHLKPTGKKIKIMERSLFSAQHIFIELLRQNKQLEKAEYDILQKWFEFTSEHFHIKPNLIVYLRAEPHEVFDRIKKRGRSEESNVKYDYIKRIHELHENWLIRKEFDDVPILVLNASLSAHEIQKEFEKLNTHCVFTYPN